MPSYKYIYPFNARYQDQLDIMLKQEADQKDPFAPDIIDQEILFKTNYWYVSRNRFPYEGAEQHFLVIALDEVLDFQDISKEMWQDLQDIWLKLAKEYDIKGGGLCMRFGDPARSGATLTRIHVHIIMPQENTKAKFGLGGRTTLKDNLHL